MLEGLLKVKKGISCLHRISQDNITTSNENTKVLSMLTRTIKNIHDLHVI